MMIKPYYENRQVKLYHGDCLDIMPQLTEKFDACITDPPYGTTSCSWDTVLPFDKMWKCVDEVVKDNAAVCIFGSQPFSSSLVMSNINKFRHEWIWHKNIGSNFANTIREPMKEHEHVLVFSNGGWIYNKQMQERSELGKQRAEYKFILKSCSENYRNFKGRQIEQINKNLRVPSSVQDFNVERGLHPTQKPVSLIEYLIKTYTDENDIVLDFCAGSGTTGVACMNTNRRCVLIEKEQKYCDIIANRLESNKDLFNMIE